VLRPRFASSQPSLSYFGAIKILLNQQSPGHAIDPIFTERTPAPWSLFTHNHTVPAILEKCKSNIAIHMPDIQTTSVIALFTWLQALASNTK
jgi:hypothetical protein